MVRVSEILSSKGIFYNIDDKIIFYNNSYFNCPISVYPDDLYDDDIFVLILPKYYPIPKTFRDVDRSIKAGIRGGLLRGNY